MAIIPRTSLSEVKAYMQKQAENLDRVVLRNLERLGMMAVTYARDRAGEDSWFDQTGNLRSSIGYVVGRDGEVVSEGGFRTILNGATGSSEGKQFANELASSYASKYFLIVVAGMKYASYVEEMDNKDVLASASLFAEKELPKMVKRIDNMLKTLK